MKGLKMKAITQIALLGVLGLLGGCTDTCGTNTYHLRGHLINAQDGKPIVGAPVVGALNSNFDPAAHHWTQKDLRKEDSITDEQGGFDALVLKSVGRMDPFWFIPGLPPPGPLDKVVLYVDLDGKWQERIITLRRSQQSKRTDNERWIELGELRFYPSGPCVTTSSGPFPTTRTAKK
jgi:hypothetical protein